MTATATATQSPPSLRGAAVLTAGEVEDEQTCSASIRSSRQGPLAISTVVDFAEAPEAPSLTLPTLLLHQEGQEEDDSPARPKLVVNTVWFQLAVGLAIFLNAILIGIEVDYDLGLAGDILHNVFTALWTLEVVFKLWTLGCRNYFCDRWNQFDFCLATSSIIDTWVVLPFQGEQTGFSQVTMARLFRLIRLVRVVRLIRLFKELWYLLNGLMRAGVALVWVFVLIGLLIYIFSILMTIFIGHECGAIHSDWAECYDYYGTLPRTMLTLLELMTLEMGSVRPVVVENPIMLVILLAYMMTTSFGLLNIIVGVIVEQVLGAAAENQERAAKEEAKRQQRELEQLAEIFLASDDNGNGSVTLEEFLGVCHQPEVQAKFADLGIPVNRRNLAQRLFEVLDDGNKGEFGVDHFLERTVTLRNEGKKLKEDQTLLLLDVRHLIRRIRRIERKLPDQEECTSPTSEGRDSLRAVLDAVNMLSGKVDKLTDEVLPLKEDIKFLKDKVASKASNLRNCTL
eukprot:TRINITY_DN30474_c0_g1_i1.p1 TRINITY_DN30474_c0_g1~~TRINITY_DN30474_c0_g1_i1.p1  ORF type:complete len:512 (-),score=95.37 TRINITY_DN30474_c0_g1_i1:61-1596(-)